MFEGDEEAEIVHSFSTFTKLMDHLSEEHQKTGSKDSIMTGDTDLSGNVANEAANTEYIVRTKIEITDEVNADEKYTGQNIDIEVENIDQKTSSEDRSQNIGGHQLVYVRLEDQDPTLHNGSSSGSSGSSGSSRSSGSFGSYGSSGSSGSSWSEGSAGSPQYCSSTQLLSSARISPESSEEDVDKDDNESESEDGKQSAILNNW